MIMSERHVYVAAHITEETKETLRQEAAKQGVSMSLLVSIAIVERLERYGHKLERKELCVESSDITP